MARGVSRLREFDRQAVEGVDVDALVRDVVGGKGSLDDLDALLDRQQRCLLRVGEHRDDHRVEDRSGPLDDVEMAVRDRVE